MPEVLTPVLVAVQPAQPGFMARHFGASWKTKLWGSAAAFCTSVVGFCVAINQASTATGPNDQDPTLQFILYAIPAKWRFWITFAAAVGTFITGQRFAHFAKDKNVVGGTTIQNAEGCVASHTIVTETTTNK